jgi:hypothetical protein
MANLKKFELNQAKCWTANEIYIAAQDNTF